jgi:lipid-A-disaccharide synthase
LPVEVCCGRTPEIIELSRACVAVSGSVGLELLYRQKPTAVVYRVRPFMMYVAKLLIEAHYISLVNLLAEREIFPEFLSEDNEAEAISARLLQWLEDEGPYERLHAELGALRAAVARPGACRRAAAFILEALQKSSAVPRKRAA